MWDRVEKFVTAYGWVAMLITFVVVVTVVAGVLWLFGVDIAALIQGRLP